MYIYSRVRYLYLRLSIYMYVCIMFGCDSRVVDTRPWRVRSSLCSDIRVSLFENRLRLRTALTTGGQGGAGGEEGVDSNMRAICDEKTFGGESSGMVVLHCRVSPGQYRLALYAEYPLGGLPPCDGFYMHLTIKPVAVLNEVGLGGVKKERQQKGKTLLLPVLDGPRRKGQGRLPRT